MNLGLYGLSGQPFGATPDPKFLYASATHREALASLQYAVHSGRGFTSLIAPPGLGKTTLLFRLLEDLQGQASTAFVFQTQCKPRELLRFILNELSIQAPHSDLVTMHQALNEHLLAQARLGKRCVIILDEAQNLNDSALESVRLLSDFETPRQKLLHIILAGQPELADRLLRPGLRQLQQRIASVCKLEPLNANEIEEYVEHRLAMAGHSGPPLFTPAAMAIIKQFSRGIPRNINGLCFAALSLGYALGKKQLDAQVLEEAASDLSFQPQRSSEFLPRSLEKRELPKEAESVATEATVAAPIEAGSDRDALPLAAVVPPNPQAEEPAPIAQIEDARDNSAIPVQVEDPVRRLEEEERARRELEPDPLQNIDLGEYALLSGAERRRVEFDVHQPQRLCEPEKAFSVVDPGPDPELEALKRHLGQVTSSTEAIPAGKAVKQVFAIVGLAAALAAVVLIVLVWTRTGTSLAYSPPPVAQPTNPSQSPAPEEKVGTPAVISPAARSRRAAHKGPASKSVAAATLNGSPPPPAPSPDFSKASPSAAGSAPSPPGVEHDPSPVNTTVAAERYQAPAAALDLPRKDEPIDDTDQQSPGQKSPMAIVDTSEPGAKPVQIVPPEYPRVAQYLKIAGTVVLRASVDEDGRVVDVQKISGDPRLVSAAIAAVRQWQYPPLTVGGKRQSTEKQIQIDFKLPVDTALTGDSK
jgi:TonB family protein